MLTYSIDTSSGKPIVYIYEDTELILEQDFNPDTGADFLDTLEAENWAKQYIDDYILGLYEEENPLLLIVKFKDPNTGQEIFTWPRNTPFQVEVTILYKPTNSPAPFSGKYLVPYFDEFAEFISTEGLIEVDIVNGVGTGTLSIDRTGMYVVMIDKIINAETKLPPEPIPDYGENPKLAIVDVVQ